MEDFLWGIINGFTSEVILIAHAFGAWNRYPFYNEHRGGGWYDFGFLIGVGSPLLGIFGGGHSHR